MSIESEGEMAYLAKLLETATEGFWIGYNDQQEEGMNLTYCFCH